ncbi:MAG: hypothetical protein IKP71_00625 [Candidatus Riflebacteria bacterium]|nr:hypothetical protein [Candidatus Riflebacteria bacterium]
MGNDNKKKKQSCLSTLIQAFILSCITTFIVFSVQNPGKKSRAFPRQKACFSNLKIIAKAVEIYNMDNAVKITELNDSTLELLINSKYLKQKPQPPELTRCFYSSEGDITKSGYIYCKYHGDLKGIKECEFNKEHDIKAYELSQKYGTLVIIGICLAPALIYILLNI